MNQVKSITFTKPPSKLQLGDTFRVSFEGKEGEVKFTVKKIVTGRPSMGLLTTRHPESE